MSRVALASGATGTDEPPLRLLSAEQFAEHERLFGRVFIEEPCSCGDCLSCDCGGCEDCHARRRRAIERQARAVRRERP